MKNYSNIKFGSFVLGVIVVALPAIALEQLGYSDWLWGYIILILIMFIVYHSTGLKAFSSFTKSLK